MFFRSTIQCRLSLPLNKLRHTSPLSCQLTLSLHHSPLYFFVFRSFCQVLGSTPPLGTVKVETNLLAKLDTTLRDLIQKEDFPSAAKVIENYLNDPSKPPPDQSTLQHAFTIYTTLKDVPNAEKTWTLLRTLKIPPTAAMYSQYLRMHWYSHSPFPLFHDIFNQLIQDKFIPTNKDLTYAIRAAVQARDFHQAELWIRVALNRKLDQRLTNAILLYYCSAEEGLGRAVVFWEETVGSGKVEPSVELYCTFLKLWVLLNNEEKVLETMKIIKRMFTINSLIYYNIVLSWYVKTWNPTEIFSTLKELKESGFTPDEKIQSILLFVYIRLGDTTNIVATLQALDSVEDMNQNRKDILYFQLVRVLVRLRADIILILEVLQVAKDYGDPIMPYYIAIKQLEELSRTNQREIGHLETAKIIFKHMKYNHIEPNIQTMNKLIQIHSYFKDNDGAKEILKQIINSKLVPDQRTFLSCFPLYSNYDKVLKVMERENIPIPVSVFNKVLEKHVWAANKTKVMQTVAKMNEKSIVPSLYTLRLFLRFYIQCRDYSCLKFILEKINLTKVTTDQAILDILQASRITNNWDLFIIMINKVITKEDLLLQDFEVFKEVIKMAAASGSSQKLFRLLDSFEEEGIVFTDVSTYNHVFWSLQNDPWYESKVESLLQTMEKMGVELDSSTYNALIMFYARSKNCKKLHFLFKEAKKRGYEIAITSKREADACLRSIYLAFQGTIEYHIERKNYAKAVTRIEEMKSQGFVVDISLYNNLISKSVSTGNLEYVNTVWPLMLSHPASSPDISTYTTLRLALKKCIKQVSSRTNIKEISPEKEITLLLYHLLKLRVVNKQETEKLVEYITRQVEKKTVNF